MPRKQLTISDMRNQSRLAHYTARTDRFNADSAYARLHEQNRDLIEGRRQRNDEDYQDRGEQNRVMNGRVAKQPKPARKKLVKKKPPTRPKEPSIPPPPEVECWRPAGGEDIFGELDDEEDPFGERVGGDSQPTATLGIARIATWRLTTFNPAAKTLIEQHGSMAAFQTEEHFHGGESVTDVFVQFDDEDEAAVVKEKINGKMVGGRKLQVKYA